LRKTRITFRGQSQLLTPGNVCQECDTAENRQVEKRREHTVLGLIAFYYRGHPLFHPGDVKFADIDEVAGNRGGGGHYRADEVRAAVAPLAALEIAI
jgi:hypothetical protein